jgi:CyaY protein
VDAQHFAQLADACIEQVIRWLDGLDVDAVDFSAGDGLLSIEFEDGTRFVLNRQTAARQMWFAAGTRAWHYDWDAAAERWADDRDGHDLHARIAEAVAEKLARARG